MRNRHPVDQLGDVRAEIGKLQTHEKKLRKQILKENDMTENQLTTTTETAVAETGYASS
jgi:hypothetical protein